MLVMAPAPKPEVGDLPTLERFQPAGVIPLQSGTEVRLAARGRGSELLSRPDRYTGRLSQFDLVAKLQGGGERTERGYLEHAKAQARDWPIEAVWRITDSIVRVGKALGRTGIRLPLPATLEVVLSTLDEEGGMHGYTRRGFVVLHESWLGPETFAHELMHVVTRRRPDLRRRFFELLGSDLVAPVVVPEALAARVITNPDAPEVDSVLAVGWRGRRVHVAPFLLANRDWDGGGLSRYVDPALLLVERDGDRWRPALRDGHAVVLARDEVDGLREQFGGNTRYDWHPEEVSAEHLELLLGGAQGLPRPDLVSRLGDILRTDQEGREARES